MKETLVLRVTHFNLERLHDGDSSVDGFGNAPPTQLEGSSAPADDWVPHGMQEEEESAGLTE